MTRLYYTPPSEEAFENMKNAAKAIWGGYDDPYRTEKLERIKDIGNVGDNFMYLFAMFDMRNQARCAALLKHETREAVRERMVAGGNPEEYIDAVLGNEI